MHESSEENEIRFQAWKENIKRNVGNADEKIFRYFWNLYELLMTEVKTLNNKYKFYQNGKKNDV
jgi:hypothetical protein